MPEVQYGVRMTANSQGVVAGFKSANDAQVAFTQQTKQAREEADRFIAKLKEQAETFGLNATQIRAYKALQLEMSEAQKQTTAELILQIDAHERQEKAIKTLAATATAAGKSIAVALAGLGAAFAYKVHGAIDMAADMDTLSVKTGVAAEQLATMKYAADVSETSLETLARAMRQLPKSLVEAQSPNSASGRAFAFLGIDPGQLKTQQQAIDTIADAVKRVEDPMARAAALQMIFKRSGEELIPFFMEGSAGLRRLQEEGAKWAQISDIDAERAKVLKDNMVTLGYATDATAKHFASLLVPRLNDSAEAFLRSAREGNNLLGVMQALKTFWIGGGEQYQKDKAFTDLTDQWLAADQALSAAKNRGAHSTVVAPLQARRDDLQRQMNAALQQRLNAEPDRPWGVSLADQQMANRPITGGAEMLAREGSVGAEKSKALTADQILKKQMEGQEELNRKQAEYNKWKSDQGIALIDRVAKAEVQATLQANQEKTAADDEYWKNFGERSNAATALQIDLMGRTRTAQIAGMGDAQARARAQLAFEIDIERTKVERAAEGTEQRKQLEQRFDTWVVARTAQLNQELKPEWQRMADGFSDGARLMRDSVNSVAMASMRAGEDMAVQWRRTGTLSGRALGDAFLDEWMRALARATIARPIGEASAASTGAMLGFLGLGGSSNSPSATPARAPVEEAVRNPVTPFKEGGVMTSRGPMPLKKYAKGGVAQASDGPQFAEFAEAGQNEAFVPLPDGRSIPVTLQGGGSGGGGNYSSNSVTVNAPLNLSIDARNAAPGTEARLMSMVQQQMPGILGQHRRLISALVASNQREGGRR